MLAKFVTTNDWYDSQLTAGKKTKPCYRPEAAEAAGHILDASALALVLWTVEGDEQERNFCQGKQTAAGSIPDGFHDLSSNKL